jgi:hypothetical protein
VVRKSGNRRAVRRGLVVLFLLIGFHAGAQVAVELSERSLVVGEELTLTIQLDYEETDDVVVPPIAIPGFRVVEGPSVRPVAMITSTGRSRVVEVRVGLVAEQAGRYVIESIAIEVAGQLFETPARLVEVGSRGDRFAVPFLARWVTPDVPLFVGEGRPMYLEIYNVDEYIYPSDITVTTPENAIFEEVTGLGTIEQRSIDGRTLFAIPVAVFMLTPSEPGLVTLPSARVESEGQVATAPSVEVLSVEPPTAIDSTGAVGSFVVTASTSAASIAASETAILTIRVEGEGNLHLLNLPEPQTNGLRIEDEEWDERLTPTDRGYRGYREVSFVLRPLEAGSASVSFAPFVFFDRDRGRVIRTAVPEFRFEVTSVKEPVSEGPAVTFDLMGEDAIADVEPVNWYRNPLAYGLFVPGLLFLIARRIWKRHGAAGSAVLFVAILLISAASDYLPWNEIQRGLDAYARNDRSGALLAFEEASRLAPESPGIQHNLAVLYFQQGDIGRAVYAAREALRLAPQSETIRSTQRLIEQTAAIEHTVEPPHFLHPDTLFIWLAIAVNALFVALSFVRSRHRAISAIAAILLGVGVVGLTAGLAVTATDAREQVGVVRAPLSLRRIPSQPADTWLDLAEGTAVDVISRDRGFVLVRTELGLEGWAPLASLLWPGHPSLDLLRYSSIGM